MPEVRLEAADAAELADMLQLLGDWLAADHGRLAASLRAFTASSGYDLSQLRRDVDRFAILLGGMTRPDPATCQDGARDRPPGLG